MRKRWNVTVGNRGFRLGVVLVAASLMPLLGGCGAGQKQARKNNDFFTSGNREADQRADQRMAKTEQLQGTGGSGGGGDKAAAKVTAGGDANKAGAKTEAPKTLYERLGGEEALKAIVDDFTTRALADPRVNWGRKGVKAGGFTINRGKSVEWNQTPEGVAQLKKHLVQFLSLSTGGPAFYDGLEMKNAHAGRHITNAEFDASVGDFKASLDKLAVPNKEQKELLSIIESTRPQVAEER